MKTSNKERQRKWRQKKVSNGMRTVTVMLPIAIKDLIDQKRQESGATIADIIETAVVRLLSAPENSSQHSDPTVSNPRFKELSTKDLHQMSADLKAIAHSFEKMAGIQSSVTCNPTGVTNNAAAEPKPQQPLPQDPLTTEIYRLVRLLNNMEVSPDEIAFTLNKRKFKTLNGSDEWKAGDVHEVLKDIHQKYGHINPLFSISDNP